MSLSLPPLVLQQVKILVTKHPQLNENTFGNEFRRMFHSSLDPAQLGHPSMNSLLCSLASAKVLQLGYENCSVVVRPSRNTVMEIRGVGDGQCDLMELDTLASHSVVSSVLPPKDVVLRFVLPVQELPARMKEGRSFPVVITQVESPSKFWFNLQMTGYFDSVKDIMARMDKFYADERGELYKVVSIDQLRQGNVLAAKYKDQGYHRVLIIKVVDSSVLKLFFVDYGTVDSQKIKHCRFLHKQFSTLPGQAIQARLWGVRPVSGGSRWGQGNRARDRMVELVGTLEGALIGQIKAGVMRKELTVKGEDKLEEERGLALSLIDVLSGDGLDVARQLVIEEMASWELWNIDDEKEVLGEEGAVCKVVKYTAPARCVGSATLAKDRQRDKGKVADIVDAAVAKNASDVVDPSPYLKLLQTQEDIMNRLQKMFVVEDEEDNETDREMRAKNWARKREHSTERRQVGQGLEDITKIREERGKLELIWAVDKELGDLC
eukprot:GFUD01032625.1.p1 GENE.GFUD01032625.1~~GFUD01032625.1.p1  ORF type:complete len:492 (+),score=153.85 GFUD01032625.1:65-1540(+)